MSIVPNQIIDGVPVFTPTFDQFKSFGSFINNIKQYGLKSGIVKVIPPKQWLDLLDNNPSYLDLPSLQNIKIKYPIQQNISGNKGLYLIQNIQRNKTYNIIQWKNLSNDYQLPNNPRYIHKNNTTTTNNNNNNNIHINDFNAFKQYLLSDSNHLSSFSIDKERLQFLESYYWKTLNFVMPIYGADTPGSLFPSNTTSNNTFPIWNLNNLPNVLNCIDKDIPGVTHSYLYAGSWKATFAWHLEDQDLYSINYIHFGSPKQWYSIPQDDLPKFESFIKDQFPNEFKSCNQYLRHKNILVSPQLLNDNHIRCNKIVHCQREFIITFPNGYHAGFNYGFNLAEAVNFADTYWLDHFAPYTKSCHCVRDSVQIDVHKLARNYYKNRLSLQEHPTDNNNNNNTTSVSLRSTSPTPPTTNTIDPLMNQSSISRVSSPFLAKMMDLSNIIEPTLEDTTLKLNKKKIASSSSTTRQNNNHKRFIQNHPIDSPTILSPSNHQNNNNNNNNNNNLVHPNPMNINRLNTTPFTFDDNDDNLLAMSLTSLANSGRSSPKNLKPILNFTTSSDFNNDMKRPTPLRPLLPQRNNNNNNNNNNNIFRPLSPFNNLLNSNNNTNGFNLLNYINNGSNVSGKITGSSPSNMPFLKRTKSSNIVTLNISREGSKSPALVPPNSTNIASPKNPLNKGDSLLSSSSVYPNLLNDNADTTGVHDNQQSRKRPRKGDNEDNEQRQQQQQQQQQRQQEMGVSSSPLSTAQGSTNFKSAPVASQTGRFTREEVIVSESGKVYMCQECKRKFSSGHHLTRHKKSVHSSEKPYSCPKCGKRFKRRDHVLQHLNKKIPCTPENDGEPSVKTTRDKQNNADHTTETTTGLSSPSPSSFQQPSVENTGSTLHNKVTVGHDMVRQESEKNEISSPPITN